MVRLSTTSGQSYQQCPLNMKPNRTVWIVEVIGSSTRFKTTNSNRYMYLFWLNELNLNQTIALLEFIIRPSVSLTPPLMNV